MIETTMKKLGRMSVAGAEIRQEEESKKLDHQMLRYQWT
jgi:hypothetical protein